MSTPPHAATLAKLAAPLEPDEPPYWVNRVRLRHRAPGWYWRPADVNHPVYLGYNHIMAGAALLQHLDRQETPT